MTNFQWVITNERKNLLDEIEKIPEYGKKKKSEIIEMALREFIIKHGASNNPQTQITIFQNNIVRAIPNIYAGSKAWNKFYKLIKKRRDFKELDKELNMIMNIHNRHWEKNIDF